MEAEEELTVGTLILDMGRIGIITKVIKSGSLETKSVLINWRVNYEIIYADGSITVVGQEAFSRMKKAGMIEVL